MKKILSFLIILTFMFCACEKKRERLANNTFSIAIDPATSIAIYSGNTVNLKAICKSSLTDNVNVVPVWSVDNNLGTFTPATGKATTFRAGNTAGSGKIYATVDANIARVNLNVTFSTGSAVGASYTVFSDAFALDLSAPGAFQDALGSPVIALSSDFTNSSEGLDSFKAVFSIVSNGWSGWFVSAVSNKNMSAYAGGHLRFDIMTAYDIQIGVRSSNTNSNTNNAKKYISSYITPNGSVFQSVSIPINDLLAAEPTLDLTQMKDMFIATAIGAQIGAQTNKSFNIDNIRWTTN